MPTYVLPTKGKEPATGGGRRDYIKPGVYKLKVAKYSDKPANSGAAMHAYAYKVETKGDEQGKQINDYFAMPKGARDSDFGVRKMMAFLLAVGVKVDTKKNMKIDPAKYVGKSIWVEIGDDRQEARKGPDGKMYPARTVSNIFEYLTESAARKLAGAKSKDADDDDEDDEDDEDEDDDEEDDDSDEDDDADDEDEDDGEDDDEDDEDEEEEEAPPAKSSKRASKSAAKAPAKAKGKKAADDFF